MAEFESCDKCKYVDKTSDEFPCNVCIHCISTADQFEPQTNADRIRAMIDEELAEFLIGFVNTFGEEYEGTLSCLEWLKSEVKE